MDKIIDKVISMNTENDLKQESFGKVDPEIIEFADNAITDYLNNEVKAEKKRK